MAKLDLLFDGWDEGHREFAIALDGCPDEDLWKRAHPALLSVGELTAHVAYWQAVWTAGKGQKPNLEELGISSPLINNAFRYYTTTIGEPVKLSIGTTEARDELMRIHEYAERLVKNLDPDFNDPVPGLDRWTWGAIIQYQVFHVAYHTGQVYSVRHLLGHQTEDN